LQDKAPQLGAALAYYTVFSLAPLILVLLAIIGVVFRDNPADAWHQLTEQMSLRKGWSFRLTVVARHLGASADTSADALLAPLVSLFGSTQPGRTKWHVYPFG